MKNNYIVLVIFIIFSFSSCNIGKEDKTQTKRSIVNYVDGKQKLSINSTDEYNNLINIPQLKVLGQDSVLLGEKVAFKLFLSHPSFQLKRAYFDCITDTSTVVDTTNFKIPSCTKELVVEDDTIKIYFRTGGETGFKQFHQITAISVDSLGYIRSHNGSFGYYVIDK